MFTLFTVPNVSAPVLHVIIAALARSRHLAKLHTDQRATWSAEGFIDALYGAGQQAESILTLQPNNTLLLLPSADGDLNSSLPRQSAGLVVEGADAEQDVLLYVIDVPDMDITFAS